MDPRALARALGRPVRPFEVNAGLMNPYDYAVDPLARPNVQFQDPIDGRPPLTHPGNPLYAEPAYQYSPFGRTPMRTEEMLADALRGGGGTPAARWANRIKDNPMVERAVESETAREIGKVPAPLNPIDLTPEPAPPVEAPPAPAPAPAPAAPKHNELTDALLRQAGIGWMERGDQGSFYKNFVKQHNLDLNAGEKGRGWKILRDRARDYAQANNLWGYRTMAQGRDDSGGGPNQ